MPVSTVRKAETISKFQMHQGDTGSPEVQVALLTARIRQLTGHLQSHSKDYAARRGLLKMVGRRSSLLKFLNTTDRARYLDVIQKLGIRS